MGIWGRMALGWRMGVEIFESKSWSTKQELVGEKHVKDRGF